MSKVETLQAKAATLPESIAAEILDFLEFVTTRRQIVPAHIPKQISILRGAFKGKLSSSAEFSTRKTDEIRLEG